MHKGKTGLCPVCGKKRRKVEEIYEREIRDLDVLDRKCLLVVDQFKIKCSCGFRGVEDLDFVGKYSLFTNRFEEYVFKLCCCMCLKNAAKLLGIDWKSVKRIDKKFLAKKQIGLKFFNPTRLGFDEVAYEKGHKYLTIVRDVDEARVIWIGIGRTKEVLDQFFKELGLSKTALLRAVVLDMWDPYIASVKQNCPQAEIVFDKFHVVKKVNEALDTVRKQEFAKASKEERIGMKHKRFLILKRKNNLEKEQQEKLEQLLEQNQILYKAYLLKEQIANILDKKNLDLAAERLEQWFENVKESGIKQFEKVVGTIKNYLYGIKNYIKHQLTNAASEAFNNKIGLLKRIAYGYRDLEYFKLKIMNTCWRSS